MTIQQSSADGGRTLVVTGAASGLGRQIAHRAVEAGWTVAAIDLDADGLAALGEIAGVYTYVADVCSPGMLAATFADIHDALGRVHGLVNSAGLTRPGPSAELAPSDWRLVIDVDLSGTFFACQAAFPYFGDDASVVNIASTASARGLPQRVAYCAAKAGVVAVTETLAAEWAPTGVRVNAVGPAWTDTPLLRDLIDSGAIDEKEMIARIPLGRLCSETDVAKSVLFLLSTEDAGFITGHTLYVDGGYLAIG